MSSQEQQPSKEPPVDLRSALAGVTIPLGEKPYALSWQAFKVWAGQVAAKWEVSAVDLREIANAQDLHLVVRTKVAISTMAGLILYTLASGLHMGRLFERLPGIQPGQLDIVHQLMVKLRFKQAASTLSHQHAKPYYELAPELQQEYDERKKKGL